MQHFLEDLQKPHLEPLIFVSKMLSKKAIIGYYGITPFFTSQIGIDQGEVISPLLWTIYYDPLLTEVNSLKLGYQIEHSWKNNVQAPQKKSLSAIISSQTFMDDVTWLTDSNAKLERILAIADEFNIMNNIQTIMKNLQ